MFYNSLIEANSISAHQKCPKGDIYGSKLYPVQYRSNSSGDGAHKTVKETRTPFVEAQ